MKRIPFPGHLEYAVYYENFLLQLHGDCHVLAFLKNQCRELISLLKSLDATLLTSAYAPGKWTIKDILQHLVDTERVFVYRAMRFARNDKTPLPFFEENEFARIANANAQPLQKLLKEYQTSRMATLAFFNNMDTAKLKKTGIASNSTMSVRACAWIIAAHEFHHFKIIKEKYLQA